MLVEPVPVCTEMCCADVTRGPTKRATPKMRRRALVHPTPISVPGKAPVTQACIIKLLLWSLPEKIKTLIGKFYVTNCMQVTGILRAVDYN